MSANQYRGQLDRKRKSRMEAAKKAADYRRKEADKRATAGKARAALAKSKSASTVKSKLRAAERAEQDATRMATEAAKWEDKASRLGKEEAGLQDKVLKAQQSEASKDARRHEREQQAELRRLRAEQASFELRVSHAERVVEQGTRELRPPKPEKLRVLILGSASAGDLRVGREQKRIRAAVEAALHRDLIELDARPAATTSDLLGGITKFRPHVVHFSGHSTDELIWFEDERDEPHEGVIVTGRAFASAVTATDDPPLLVLMNSCNSAAQARELVQGIVPFAIGMADQIDDSDAIVYAAQFYAAVANGHSIMSAHRSGQAALELAGLEGADLPTLSWADDVDPADALLVQPGQ